MKFRVLPILLLLSAAPISVGVLKSVGVDTPEAHGIRANKLFLFRASPFEVRPGDILTLDGSGFSKTSNKIYFNSGNEVVATSSNGISMKVVVPSLSMGDYRLSVSNSLGEANGDKKEISVMVRVTNSPISPPTIEKASISGESITLTGSGFTGSNYIYSTFGNSSQTYSSNGSTLTFSLSDLALYSKIKASTKGKKYPTVLWITVSNEHGSNREPYQMQFSI